LRRLKGSIPQFGFVHPDAPDYAIYFDQLSSVGPDFANFVSVESKHDVMSPSTA
jgi:hypothetical protein